MERSHPMHIPPAGHAFALPLYDRLASWLGLDATRESLTEHAALRDGMRVLDVGCGTGTLAVHVKTRHPGVEVVGLDPDRPALVRARTKAERARVDVRFDHGVASSLPHPDASFDRVFSTFMLHHLDERVQAACLGEARRVLASDGSLHLLDFAAPSRPEENELGRHLSWNARSRSNTDARILGLLRDAGFREAGMVSEHRVRFGRVAHFTATVERGGSNARRVAGSDR